MPLAGRPGRASGNRSRQEAVIARQQFLNESAQLRQFNTRFIQSLANLAAQTNDANIRQLLADHGVTFTVQEEHAEQKE